MISLSIKQENEYKKIKQYIINPIGIGLWETTFNILPQEEDSFLSFINNFFQNPQERTYSMNNIITILSNMYDTNNTFMEYNISDKNKNYIKKFIERHKIKKNQNYLTIDEEFFFISQNNYNIKILSLNNTLGDNLEKICEELKYATLEKKDRLFSPKAILFEPYFNYVEIISDNLFDSRQEEVNYFNRALKSYNNSEFSINNHKYEESIRIIGKAFESKLTHIYETLLRKDASHLSSIGKLLSSIEDELKKILENTNQQRKYTNESISKEIYHKCKELEKNNEESPQKIINIFRDIATKIKEQLKTTENRVLFSPKIQIELDNMISLRNQVSHHNTTQSTQENAISMLFSYIQVYLWWQEISQSVQNWDGTKKEVIEEFEELKQNDEIMKFNSFLEKKYIPKDNNWLW